MPVIKINGNTFRGESISISNNKVFVDGKRVDKEEEKEINITVEGNVDKISADSCDSIKVSGDVGQIKTMSGDVECRDVSGNVRTMSGDVECSSIAGNASSMSGDIG